MIVIISAEQFLSLNPGIITNYEESITKVIRSSDYPLIPTPYPLPCFRAFELLRHGLGYLVVRRYNARSKT
jgi:hypothetical protein